MILLIDNYDSFVYNLSRYFRELGQQTFVVRNDDLSIAEVRSLRPDAVVLSPGPCTPSEAGVCVEVVRQLSGEVAILGVCLGHQAIGAAFGAAVVRANEPVHGRSSLVEHSAEGIFEELPQPLRATRYHSLVIDEHTLPTELSIIAQTRTGVPMAVAHRTHRTFGVQFHPESVLTQDGHRLLQNFLRLAGCSTAENSNCERSINSFGRS